MDVEALKYFHRLRRQGFTHIASRNMTLSAFSGDFLDWAKRMRRYVDMPIYPEFMRFGIDDAGIVSLGSEGDVLRALNAKANPRFRISEKEGINDVINS